MSGLGDFLTNTANTVVNTGANVADAIDPIVLGPLIRSQVQKLQPTSPVPQNANLQDPYTRQLAEYNTQNGHDWQTPLTPGAVPKPSVGPQIKQILSAASHIIPQEHAQAEAQPSSTPTPGPQFSNGQPAVVPPNITIPTKDGNYTLPPDLAQNLLNNFNAAGEATHAAQVLRHPNSETYTPQEVQQFGHPSYNYGENASFQPVKDTTNNDGSVDRGLFRINNKTFEGYMSNPQSRAILEKHGITNWDDMNDPEKNAFFASLLQSNRGWEPWFAAPLDLRTGNYSGTNAISVK